jgi:hypothetical protein
MPSLSIYRRRSIVAYAFTAAIAFVALMLCAHPAAAANLGLNASSQDLTNVMSDLTSSSGGSGTSATLPSWMNWHNFISFGLYTIVPLVALYAIVQVLHGMAESKTPGHTLWSFVQVGGILVVATLCILAPLKLMAYQQSEGAELAIVTSGTLTSHAR